MLIAREEEYVTPVGRSSCSCYNQTKSATQMRRIITNIIASDCTCVFVLVVI